MEAVLRRLALGDVRRILVGHPAGVDAVHVDAVGVVVGRRGARHHVQRGLRHVRVRVPRGLEAAVELALHRRHVDDVLVALGVRSISGFSRALSTNGATALTSCISSSSTDDTSASSSRHELRSRRSTCCRSWSRRPSGKSSPLPAASSGQERHLRELGGRRDAGDARERRRLASARPWPARACRRGAAPRTRRAAAARARASARPTRSRAPACGGRSRAAGARSGRRC